MGGVMDGAMAFGDEDAYELEEVISGVGGAFELSGRTIIEGEGSVD